MIDLLFSLGATLTIVSYMLTNIFYLRLLLIIASTPYIIGAFMAGYEKAGMKATIYFSLGYMVVNSIQLIRIILNKRPVFLSHELTTIYFQQFHHMTPKDFLRLYKLGETKVVAKGVVLTKQSQPVKNLILIVNGSIEIFKDDKKVTELAPGHFIGEMSFLSGELASATSITNSEVKYIAWDKEKLNKLESKNISLFSDLKNAISFDLIKKLDMQSANSL